MKKKKKKRGSLVWCGRDQPGVFPRVAGVPLGIWVRGGMGWDGIRAVGRLGERLVGGELYGVFVLSCLRLVLSSSCLVFVFGLEEVSV